MKARLIAFALRRLDIAKLIPTVVKMLAEGRVDEALGLKAYPLKRFYWFAAGKKTWTGVAFGIIGAGLEQLCGLSMALSPEMAARLAWSCPAAHWAYVVFAWLVTIGLADRMVRSPYPAGTTIPEAAKTR